MAVLELHFTLCTGKILNPDNMCVSPREELYASSSGGCFLLFTSGSTGTLKGVLLKNTGVMIYAAAKSLALGLERELVMAPSKFLGDLQLIARLMLKHRIEITICTLSEYLMLTTYALDRLPRCLT
ncbi:hypothetical protein HD806DRAFT_533349 [Xylariaceae sp. AK1471]|nr:hypothetical protein HD806DRAFT_533349 [Xylariaceae sp. AK1471]